jgi:hypothetical protein
MFYERIGTGNYFNFEPKTGRVSLQPPLRARSLARTFSSLWPQVPTFLLFARSGIERLFEASSIVERRGAFLGIRAV